MMSRKKLPNRRPCETFTVHDPHGSEFEVSVGYDPATDEVGEVFFSGRGKSGATYDGLLFDAGVLLSIAIQHGTPVASLAASSAKLADGSPASIVGLTLAEIAAA